MATTFDVGREVSVVELFLQGESVEEGNVIDVEDLELRIFDDPKVPENGGLPPLVIGGVEFFGNR